MAAQAPVELKIANYELVRAVGQGGMAQVWLARRALVAGATKACALKVPLRHLASDERFVRMFLAEARLAMGLTHSNIVGTFDAGADGDLLYMAMEWVDGVDLAKLQQTMRQASLAWSIPVAAHVVGEILQGLSYAHTFGDASGQRGIIHRDISPHNVLVSASGEVKLTDFGIARMMGEETSHEHAKGKLRYMAAEQLRGHATQRSDLFAAGAIFHELLEGQKFRDGLSGDAFFGAILQGSVPPLSRPDVPEILETLRRGLLEPDEHRRLASADDALSLLAKWPGYRSQRVALRKAVSRHMGGDQRASGLTGCVPWTAEMAQTLQVIEEHRLRRGAAVVPGPGAAPDTQPYGAAAVAVPESPTQHLAAPAIVRARRETTAFMRPAMVDREAPTATALPRHSDATWSDVPKSAQRRTRLWVGAAMALGMVLGGSGAFTAWWMFARGETPSVPTATADPGIAAAPAQGRSPAPTEAPPPETPPTEAPPTEAPPTEAPSAPVVAARPTESPADPVPAGAEPEVAPAVPPAKAKAKLPRVQVHVVLDFVDEAEIAIDRMRRVVRGPARLQVTAGRHRVAWRPPGTQAWLGQQTLQFEAGRDQLIRVRPSGLRHESVAARRTP